MRPTPGRTHRWQVRYAGWVGAAVLTGSGARIDLRVAPKVPVDRLLYLMSYSGRREPWRNEVVDLPVAQGLPGCIAEIFARLVDRALRAGVLQGYRTIEAPEPTVRGRVRFHDQVRRRFGRSLPAEITYDEFTLDIAENRILRAANQRMIKVPGLPDTTKRRLLLQSRRLETIADLVAGRPLPVWTPNRLNARY